MNSMLLLKNIVNFCVVLFVSFSVYSQITGTIIDPSSDGGFEQGATFGDNDWTVVSSGTNIWALGTATQPAGGGTRTAYISNDGGTSNNYSISSTSRSHLYKEVTVPAIAEEITLSFTLKSRGENSNYDQLLVFTGTGTPSNSVPSGTTTTMAGFTNVFTQNSTTTWETYQNVEITLDPALAGTTFNLVFTWKNDGSVGTNPPAAIDNIELVYTYLPECFGTPFGGAAGADKTQGCDGINNAITLTAQGFSSDQVQSGLSYQWQYSTNGVDWFNIIGATTPVQAEYTANTTTYFRLAVTCTPSGEVAYSNELTYTATVGCNTVEISDGGTVNLDGNNCSVLFYDSGGAAGSYGNNENETITFCSNNGQNVKVEFLSYDTEDNGDTGRDQIRYDILDVYEGPTTADPQKYSLSGVASALNRTPIIISTGECLTFNFTSDGSAVRAGWEALVTCTDEENNVASNFCETAPNVCNINGYRGSTSNFYNIERVSGQVVDGGTYFPGSSALDNNSFIKFVASANSVDLDITVENCSPATCGAGSEGIQMVVIEGNNCTFNNIIHDASSGGGLDEGFHNITMTGFTPGTEYYLLIDGANCSMCDYSIDANSGIDLAEIDNTSAMICEGDNIDLTASGGTDYLWNGPGVVGEITPTVNVDQQGIYSVEVTSGLAQCPDQVTLFSTVISNPNPVANLTGTTTICADESYTMLIGDVTAENGTILWTHDGQGTIDNNTTETPTYNAVAGDAGNTVTLTMTVSSNHCGTANDTYALEISNENAITLSSAVGTNNQNVCINTSIDAITYTTTGATGANFTGLPNGVTGNWNANTVNISGTPDVAGTYNYEIELTGGCGTVTENGTITVEELPSISIPGGNDQATICENGSHTVAGISIDDANFSSWVHDGNGTLDDAGTLTPTYNAASGDAGNTVTLTLTVESNNSCGASAEETLIVEIDVEPLPTIDLPGGNNQATICEDDSHTVAGIAINDADFVSWVHDGNGTLDDAGTLAPTYNADPADAGNTVTLTLTIESNNTCGTTQETLDVQIDVEPLPTIDIPGGNDQATICEDDSHTVVGIAINDADFVSWVHDGNGTLDDAGTLTPTYNADPADAGNTVTLTLTVESNNSCGTVQETLAVEIDVEALPTIDIPGGNDQATICEIGSHTVAGISINDADFVSWVHDGNGTLDDAGTLTPTYNADAADAGNTVTLTLTVESNNSCGTVQETLTVEIDVEPLPTIDLPIGEDEVTMCEDDSHTVSNVVINNGTFLGWAHDGNGTLDDDGTLTPTYNAVPADAGNTVTLTLTVQSDNSCGLVQENLTIELEIAPVAVAEVDASGTGNVTICEVDSYTVTTMTLENGTILWTHDGAGSIADATTATPTYTPAAADAGNTVTLTATVTGSNNCNSGQSVASETFTIDVVGKPVIDQLADQEHCDEYTLPTITGDFLTDAAYYTGLAGTGTRYESGETLNYADFASYPVTLYLYDDSGVNLCEDEADFELTLHETPSYTLSAMDPSTCNGNDGYIYVENLIAGVSYSIMYTDGVTSNGPTNYIADAQNKVKLDGLVSGSYDVTVTLAGTSCSGNTLSVSLNNPDAPTINNISSLAACDSYTLPAITGIDLTGDEAYYTAPGGPTGTGQVLPVGTEITTTQTIYAYDANGICADQKAFTVNVNETPVLDPIEDIEECDAIRLDPIQGSIVTSNASYFTQPNGNGTEFAPGTTIYFDDLTASPMTLYAYDETATTPNCSAEVSFQITIHQTPIIDPLDDQEACDSYTLPTIDGEHLVNPTYYTDALGQGQSYSIGDVINYSDFASYPVTLYIYDETETATNCFSQQSFQLTLHSTPIIDALANQEHCDSFELPTITGSNLVNALYYTDQNGMGTEYAAGDIINYADFPNYPVTLYIYDETATTVNCSAEVAFELILNQTPIIDQLTDQEACAEFELHSIDGDNLINPAYYTDENGGGTTYEGGDIINLSDFANYPVTLYMYDETGTTPNCFDEKTFELTIHELPTADILNGGDVYCDYDTPNDITIAVSGSPDWEVTYTLDGVTASATGSSSPVSLGNETGEYIITQVRDANCTSIVDQNNVTRIEIKESPEAPVVTTADEYCYNNEFEPMTATGEGVLTWYLADDYSNEVHVGETYTPANNLGATNYFVSSTVDGCESDLTIVPVSIIACDIIIPEAITPNADGFNDVLYIENLEVYPNTKLTIYNRWGVEVFHSDNYTNDWDGKSTNSLSMGDDTLPEGTYYYLLILGGEEDHKLFNAVYKGWIYLKP